MSEQKRSILHMPRFPVFFAILIFAYNLLQIEEKILALNGIRMQSLQQMKLSLSSLSMQRCL